MKHILDACLAFDMDGDDEKHLKLVGFKWFLQMNLNAFVITNSKPINPLLEEG